MIMLSFESCKTHKSITTNKKESRKIDKDSVKRWTYNRLLNTKNFDIKYIKANEYYEKKKYSKALELYSQLVPHEKGLARGEEVAFKEAMCTHKTGDNMYAGYLFKKFYQTYPNSKYSEEALFLSAYCYYLDVPRWSLDQQITNEAISQFQFFLSKFPNNKLVDSCNILVEQMNNILEKKSYENSKLYYDLEYFKAAEIALLNSAEEYPDSEFREEIYYYICKTSFEYAQKSTLDKQSERYRASLSYCIDYYKLFPSGKYFKEVNKIETSINKKLKNI